MGKISVTKLSARREAFRLWFEYLKIARSSNEQKIKSALVVSKPYYAPWQMDSATRFDAWWKSHGLLFEEKYVVRRLDLGELPQDKNALIVEIPLTQSPTILTKKVKALIQSAFEDRTKEKRKKKGEVTADYKMSEGAEPKLLAVREMLTVYRDVYLKNKQLKGRKLLDAVHRYYQGRKQERHRAIPLPLMLGKDRGDDDVARALRNLNRYIQKAEKIVLNVARGQFPGKY